MNNRRFYQHELNERWGWASFWTFWLLVANLIGVAVWDGQGRKDYHHTTPIPAGVEALSDDTFIVKNGAMTATELCQGADSSSGDRIVAVRELKLGGEYIECGHNQYWNDKRAKSLNFGGAVQAMFTHPLVLIGNAGALWLFFQFPLRYKLAWRKQQALNKKQTKKQELEAREAERMIEAQQMVRFEKLKSELVAEWSKPDSLISDEAFERKLGQLEQRRDRGEL